MSETPPDSECTDQHGEAKPTHHSVAAAPASSTNLSSRCADSPAVDRDNGSRKPDSDSRFRWVWLAGAYFFMALGLVGLFLPVVPTVPFLIAAAFCASRGSRRMHAWLLKHPQFGRPIRQWMREGAVSRKAKWLATATMTGGAAFSLWLAPKPWIGWTVVAVMVAILVWLWQRPEPRTR